MFVYYLYRSMHILCDHQKVNVNWLKKEQTHLRNTGLFKCKDSETVKLKHACPTMEFSSVQSLSRVQLFVTP